MNEFNGVKIEGHKGTWYSVDVIIEIINGKRLEIALFEHERYGDEAAHVIATTDGVLLMENVWNGWSDWREYFIDEQPREAQALRSYNWTSVISI